MAEKPLHKIAKERVVDIDEFADNTPLAEAVERFARRIKVESTRLTRLVQEIVDRSIQALVARWETEEAQAGIHAD